MTYLYIKKDRLYFGIYYAQGRWHKIVYDFVLRQELERKEITGERWLEPLPKFGEV